MNTAIQQVRSFNRIVAERIGAFHDRFLGRARPMSEARLLWEIGPAGAEIREIRRRLSLDSGYVSRVLRSLEKQGLVSVRPELGDHRVRRVRLTKRGRAEHAELDRRSNVLAQRILEPLSEKQRTVLATAMAQVERLLEASMVRISIEEPTTADAKWCIGQYFAELDTRFEKGFKPELSISADASELTPPAGALLIARLREQPVGCGALKIRRSKVTELKRMWIAPSVRGRGLGRRLLMELEQYARAQGTAVIRLETNRALSEAIALYRQSGYVEVDAFNDEPYAHHWFEKRLRKRP
jgi:DNA-binding MarR family transcriptional regulator/GNAT superfamily N-acetyltransferase